jgi:hypothetical protein
MNYFSYSFYNLSSFLFKDFSNYLEVELVMNYQGQTLEVL